MKNEKILKVYINKKSILININKDSKIYSSISSEFDITIIRIDEDDINDFLEIDENIFKDKQSLLIKMIIYLYYIFQMEKKQKYQMVME